MPRTDRGCKKNTLLFSFAATGIRNGNSGRMQRQKPALRKILTAVLSETDQLRRAQFLCFGNCRYPVFYLPRILSFSEFSEKLSHFRSR